MTNILNVFSDGSLNPPTGTGCGAYLITPDLNQPLPFYQSLIQCKIFHETNSTRLELQIVLWALDQIAANFTTSSNIICHTDSNNIVNLMGRKLRLQRKNYLSDKGKTLNNADLYQQFFTLTEQFACTFIKVKGHRPASTSNQTERIFTLVDQAARKSLRATITQSRQQSI